MSNRLDWITKYNRENNNEYGNFVFTGKYLAIQSVGHPKARSDGYVYIHQLQAEKKLGRPLNTKECVHHIDENKYNNDIDNLMVFKTNSDHTAFHSGCEIYLDKDVWVAREHKNSICPICMVNKKSFKAKMCVECHLKKKSLNIPSKETLIGLILQYPITKIGEAYKVSDNAVRKWCKKYNLPFSKNGINELKHNLM